MTHQGRWTGAQLLICVAAEASTLSYGGCRLTTAIAGSCDLPCLEAMDWMATVHLRSRFCAADVLPDAQAKLAATNAVLRCTW